MKTDSTTCPLCQDDKSKHYHEDSRRPYLHCLRCDLVYVPQKFHLSSHDEKLCYDLHENNPEDSGYRKFLSRLSEPMITRLNQQHRLTQSNELRVGLDFGCGPGPTLSVMMEEAGYQVNLYDIYYQTDKSVLEQRYDFITSTEVFEHLADPFTQITRLMSILKPGGFLGLMTKLIQSPEKFKTWHYIMDDTHITYFSQKSFMWLARRLDSEVEFIGNDVIILQKKKTDS